MRIAWNPDEARFETQIPVGPTWDSDMESIRKSGMRCSGPPDWTWHSTKSGPLSFLRLKRPASGLTITPEALQNYNRIKAIEDKNAEVKAQFKAARKELKQSAPDSAKFEMGPEGFRCWKVEPGESKIWAHPAIPPPTMFCSVCRTPVYSYECQQPPLCLDCEFSTEF